MATKFGTRAELEQLAKAARGRGMNLYWDAVLNHRFGADRAEWCRAREVDDNDRTHFVSDEYRIQAWVGFDFAARKGRYSTQAYHWFHFSGVDWNQDNGKKAVYKIVGHLGDDKWEETDDVDSEKGN